MIDFVILTCYFIYCLTSLLFTFAVSVQLFCSAAAEGGGTKLFRLFLLTIANTSFFYFILTIKEASNYYYFQLGFSKDDSTLLAAITFFLILLPNVCLLLNIFLYIFLVIFK